MNQSELIETVAKNCWDLKASIKWDSIPNEWKPFYLEQAKVAVETFLTSEKSS